MNALPSEQRDRPLYGIAASLSLGQLSILARGVRGVPEFVQRITPPVTTMRFNALLDFVGDPRSEIK